MPYHPDHLHGTRSRWTGWVLWASLAFPCAVAGAGVGDAVAAAQKASDLMVAEANGGIVKIASAASAVEFSVTVVNTTHKPIGGIVARLNPFTDGTGPTAVPRIDDGAALSAPFALEPYAARSLKLGVTLNAPGVHAAKLWLGAGSAALVTAIEVTRTDKPPVLTIGNLLPFKVDAPFYGPASGRAQNVSVTLAGGSGELSLARPTLQSVLYKPDDKVSMEAPGVTLLPPPAPLGLLGSVPDTTFKGAPNPGIDVPVAFAGFPSAGRYEATLLFASPASAPVSRTVAIYVREGWPMAALWIGFGVVLAFVLRIVGTVLAPRLALETRAAALFNQLRETRDTAPQGDAAGLAVVDTMRAALTARWNALAANGRLVGSTDLDAYDAKIPLLRDWLQLRTWLNQGLPPTTQALAQRVLDAAQSVLRNPAATAADISAQAALLAALPSQLDASAVVELEAAVADLERALRGSVDRRLRDLHTELRTLPKTMPGDAASIRTLAESLNRLRLHRAGILIDDLRGVLKRPAPRQIAASKWQELTEACTRLLDDAAPNHADARIAAYTEAFAKLAAVIATAVGAEAGVAAAAAGPQAAAWQIVQANAQAVLAGVAASPPTGAPADLMALLDDSQRLHSADTKAATAPAVGARASRGFQPQALPVALDIKALVSGPAASAGAGWLNFLGYGPAASALTGSGALSKARRRERWVSGIALLVIGGLAILAGVQALWANNWVWGGATAYLAAFLWGAGLSGFTFDGVKNLLSKWSP